MLEIQLSVMMVEAFSLPLHQDWLQQARTVKCEDGQQEY